MYKLTLNIAGTDYKTKGETIDEAIAALDLSWNQIKGKGTVKIEEGKTTCEHLFQKLQLQRIFSNKITRYMWAKRLALLLKEKQTNA